MWRLELLDLVMKIDDFPVKELRKLFVRLGPFYRNCNPLCVSFLRDFSNHQYG